MNALSPFPFHRRRRPCFGRNLRRRLADDRRGLHDCEQQHRVRSELFAAPAVEEAPSRLRGLDHVTDADGVILRQTGAPPGAPRRRENSGSSLRPYGDRRGVTVTVHSIGTLRVPVTVHSIDFTSSAAVPFAYSPSRSRRHPRTALSCHPGLR